MIYTHTFICYSWDFCEMYMVGINLIDRWENKLRLLHLVLNDLPNVSLSHSNLNVPEQSLSLVSMLLYTNILEMFERVFITSEVIIIFT